MVTVSSGSAPEPGRSATSYALARRPATIRNPPTLSNSTTGDGLRTGDLATRSRPRCRGQIGSPLSVAASTVGIAGPLYHGGAATERGERPALGRLSAAGADSRAAPERETVRRGRRERPHRGGSDRRAGPCGSGRAAASEAAPAKPWTGPRPPSSSPARRPFCALPQPVGYSGGSGGSARGLSRLGRVPNRDDPIREEEPEPALVKPLHRVDVAILGSLDDAFDDSLLQSTHVYRDGHPTSRQHLNFNLHLVRHGPHFCSSRLASRRSA